MKNVTRTELLPALLYIAPGELGEEETVNEKYYAGATQGAIDIAVHENVHSVRDMLGNCVCDIHYGGKMEIKGRLASISPGATALLFGSERVGQSCIDISDAPSARRLSICIVCPIKGEGGAFTLFMRASASSGTSLRLDPTGGDAISFSITSERSPGHCAASLAFGRVREEVGA